MKVAVSTLAAHDLTLRDAIDLLAPEFGALDLGLFESWTGTQPSDLLRHSRLTSEISRLVEQYDVEVVAVNVGFRDDIVPAELDATIELAEACRAPVLTLQAPAVSWQELRGVLHELAERSHTTDVQLSIENHIASGAESPAQLERILAECPSLGATFDPSHAAYQGLPLTAFQRIFDRLVHVHYRNGVAGQLQSPPDHGDVSAQAFLALLTDQGYDDAVSIEYIDDLEQTRLAHRLVNHELSRRGSQRVP